MPADLDRPVTVLACAFTLQAELEIKGLPVSTWLADLDGRVREAELPAGCEMRVDVGVDHPLDLREVLLYLLSMLMLDALDREELGADGPGLQARVREVYVELRRLITTLEQYE